MKLTRRQFITSSLGLGGLGYMRIVEPELLEVTRRQVTLHRTPARPVRLLHLSDFHYSDVVSLGFIERAIRLGIAERPDLICLTGDFVTSGTMDLRPYGTVLELLSKTAPTYACLGNHDGGAWVQSHEGYQTSEEIRAMLAAHDIRLLWNESRQVDIGESRLTLVGLGDLWSGEVNADRAFEGLAQSSPEPLIVLAHNPDTKDYTANYPWDLMLCGHTHGGQLIIPFLGAAPLAPVRDGRFTHGLCDWNGRPIHVTRGVGSIHGLRLNCRPEVSLLTLA